MTLPDLLRLAVASVATVLGDAHAAALAAATDTVLIIDESAQLASDGSRRVLLLGTGERIQFLPAPQQVAVPIRFEAVVHQLTLSGADGRYRLSDHTGRQWRFVAGRPTRRRDAGRVWTAIEPGAADQSSIDSDRCPVICEDDSQPPPHAFDAGPSVPGATTLDARPASCRSYFTDYPPIERGSQIESGVALLPEYSGLTATPRSFASIDFISATELISLTSRDLGAASYDAVLEPDALFDALLRDGRDIERQILEPLRLDGHVEHQELGAHIRIDATPARHTVLQLVVRHGLASPGQIAQIVRARHELQLRYGIELRVTEIP